VRIFGEVSDSVLSKLRKGVTLEDGEARFDKISRRKRQGEDSQNNWFDVVLTEGRNREVRRLWESQEVKVSRLIRSRYGEISLKKGLPTGAWLELGLEEINYLRQSVQLPKETESQVDSNEQKINAVRTNRLRRTVKKFEWKKRVQNKED
jgi:23S rRNA pseudouridine2605 synthase